jgi:hypothetical protein
MTSKPNKIDQLPAYISPSIYDEESSGDINYESPIESYEKVKLYQTIEEKDQQLKEKGLAIAEKDLVIAEKNLVIANKESVIER